MCIIIGKPKGVALPNQTILSGCFNRNPDGAGLMYFDPERGLILRKGIMDKEEFLTVCEQLRERYPNSPVIIHWKRAASPQLALTRRYHKSASVGRSCCDIIIER